MVNFPQDVLIDILARLPVKSVVRFKCVCKSWRSLISERHFVKAHLNRSITDINVSYQKILLQSSPLKSMDYEALQINGGDYEPPQINGDNATCTSLDFLTRDPENDQFLVSGSCNGMVCIVVDDAIILCNPCTRDVKELPNPSSSTFNGMGLGYDSSVDDYKVVINVPAAMENEGQICYSGGIQGEVYSLRNNSWRRLPDIHRNIDWFGRRFGGALFNGVLHWLARIGNDLQIISFDLATEKYHELLPLPPNPGDDDFCSLNVLGGYLSIDCYEYYVKHDIWVMKDYGLEASWTKLFTIREDNATFGNDYYLRPVCFTKNGDLLVDVDSCRLIVYNWKEDTSDLVYYNPNPDWHDLVDYCDTLVSPNCYG